MRPPVTRARPAPLAAAVRMSEFLSSSSWRYGLLKSDDMAEECTIRWEVGRMKEEERDREREWPGFVGRGLLLLVGMNNGAICALRRRGCTNKVDYLLLLPFHLFSLFIRSLPPSLITSTATRPQVKHTCPATLLPSPLLLSNPPLHNVIQDVCSAAKTPPILERSHSLGCTDRRDQDSCEQRGAIPKGHSWCNPPPARSVATSKSTAAKGLSSSLYGPPAIQHHPRQHCSGSDSGKFVLMATWFCLSFRYH